MIGGQRVTEVAQVFILQRLCSRHVDQTVHPTKEHLRNTTGLIIVRRGRSQHGQLIWLIGVISLNRTVIIRGHSPKSGYPGRLFGVSIMPYSRPSDEDIIKYEQSIMEKEVNCTPLVSQALPILSLCEEYENTGSYTDKILV